VFGADVVVAMHDGDLLDQRHRVTQLLAEPVVGVLAVRRNESLLGGLACHAECGADLGP
jgi:hypothetical protein